jgi:hypothetical protein
VNDSGPIAADAVLAPAGESAPAVGRRLLYFTLIIFVVGLVLPPRWSATSSSQSGF